MNEPVRSKLLVGIDAGGTKTRAVLGQLHGERIEEIGAGTAGPGNVRTVGIATTIANINTAIQNAFESAGRSVVVADAACLCVAGAGRDEERDWLAAAALRAQVAGQVKVVSDADVLFASAIAERDNSPQETECVCLIAGTGSIAIGQGNAGRTLRCGGWGYLFGDGGSGFAIGRAALKLIAEAADELTSEPQLTDAVLQHLQLATAQDLIGWCYSGSESRGRIAGLAPVIFELRNDRSAGKILAAAASSLARQACNVVRRLSLVDPILVCGGSLLTKQPDFRAQVLDAINISGVALQGVCVVERPELGALEIARKL